MIIEILRSAYLDNLDRSADLLPKVPSDRLFAVAANSKTLEPRSVAAYLLRSGAALEQVIGGLTRRLWDDPFEWTLPEALNTPEMIAEYLNEVRNSVVEGFSFFSSDSDLMRTVPAPIQILPIGEVLIKALCRAAEHQGRALACFDELHPELKTNTYL